MVKKVLRWISMLCPVVFVLPMFLNTWALDVTALGNTARSDGFGIFALEDFSQISEAKSVWLTLFAVFAVIALVLSVGVLVVYLLNDLKVTKLQKVEKFLSGALVLVTLLGTIFGIVAICANSKLLYSAVGNTIISKTSLVGLGGLWIFIVGGLILSVLALVTASCKTSKKRK